MPQAIQSAWYSFLKLVTPVTQFLGLAKHYCQLWRKGKISIFVLLSGSILSRNHWHLYSQILSFWFLSFWLLGIEDGTTQKSFLRLDTRNYRRVHLMYCVAKRWIWKVIKAVNYYKKEPYDCARFQIKLSWKIGNFQLWNCQRQAAIYKQYIMQFLCIVFIFHEPPLIWLTFCKQDQVNCYLLNAGCNPSNKSRLRECFPSTIKELRGKFILFLVFFLFPSFFPRTQNCHCLYAGNHYIHEDIGWTGKNARCQLPTFH